jgi:ribosomal protein S18 acetylase RimI-like enzyme
MRLQDDPWLAQILGRAAFTVRLDGDEDVSRLPALVDAHAAGRPAAFYSARVPAHDVMTLRWLAASGFEVVDLNVTLVLKSPVMPALTSRVVVAEVRPEQHEAVLDIAGSCFRYSRFHLDPRFPDALAHRVKREWTANCLTGGRGDGVSVALSEGKPAGFLAALIGDRDGYTAAVIDLVGVSPEDQSRGLGKALVWDFMQRFRDRGETLEVGTQAANVPSLRLYEGLGFRVSATSYVLHKHVGPALAG